MAHLLFVCEGNVCRSPFAERVMQLMLPMAPGGRISVASAGLSPMLGWSIADETAAIIDRLGAQSGGHSARELRESDLASATLVLTATRSQRARAVLMYPRAVQYTFTIRQLGHVLGHAFPQGPPPPPADASPTERLAAVAEQCHEHLGLSAGLEAELDVVDPFSKKAKVHARAAGEMMPALNLLALDLGGVPLRIPEPLASAATNDRSRRGRGNAG